MGDWLQTTTNNSNEMSESGGCCRSDNACIINLSYSECHKPSNRLNLRTIYVTVVGKSLRHYMDTPGGVARGIFQAWRHAARSTAVIWWPSAPTPPSELYYHDGPPRLDLWRDPGDYFWGVKMSHHLPKISACGRHVGFLEEKQSKHRKWHSTVPSCAGTAYTLMDQPCSTWS